MDQQQPEQHQAQQAATMTTDVYQPLLTGEALTQLLRGQALVAKGQVMIASALASMQAVAVPAPDRATVFDARAALTTMADDKQQLPAPVVIAAESGETAKPAAAKKRKRAAAPKRITGYLHYFANRMKSMDKSVFPSHKDVVIAIAREWRGLSDQEKLPYEQQAQLQNEDFKHQFALEHPEMLEAINAKSSAKARKLEAAAATEQSAAVAESQPEESEEQEESSASSASASETSSDSEAESGSEEEEEEEEPISVAVTAPVVVAQTPAKKVAAAAAVLDVPTPPPEAPKRKQLKKEKKENAAAVITPIIVSAPPPVQASPLAVATKDLKVKKKKKSLPSAVNA